MNQILILGSKNNPGSNIKLCLSHFLRPEAYNTVITDSKEEALRIIDSRLFHLIFLDVYFSASLDDGSEIFNKVREKYPYVPVVVVTDNITFNAENFLERGAIDSIYAGEQITQEQMERWEEDILLCRQYETVFKRRDHIRGILSELRKNMPRRKIDTSKPSDIMGRLEFLKGKTARALNVILTPTGCCWADKGGCTICGEFYGSNQSNFIDTNTYVTQFLATSAREIKAFQPSWLRIYNEGSFFNPNELGMQAQERMIEIASNIEGIERITIESRPEFITQESIQRVRSKLKPGVELEVGMGFESHDIVVREVIINKGIDIYAYKKALNVLKENNTRCLAYVALKPPFLSELDAIQDTENTIKHAFEMNFDAASIEPISVHTFSFTDLLHSQGLFQPPWLWSVVQVAKNVFHLGEIRIGGYEYYPRPTTVAHNRHSSSDICNSIFWNIIAQYNATHNADLFSFLRCSCFSQWQQELQHRTWELNESIGEILGKVDVNKYLKEKSK